MRFGKSAQEAAEEPTRSGEAYIRYLKKGENTFRILDEPTAWVYYWEHFNPGGYSFPCTNDRETCPGCTSEVEKMKKASRQVAFHTLNGEYVNVVKIPNRLAEMLIMRHDRKDPPTITDRDYTITKFTTQQDRVEYDIESGDVSTVKVDKDKYEDIEVLLAAAYDQSWGDPNTAAQSREKAQAAADGTDLASKIKKSALEQEVREAKQSPVPPTEPEAKSDEAEGEVEVSESDLRKMKMDTLVAFLEDQGYSDRKVKQMGDTVDEVVDHLMKVSA